MHNNEEYIKFLKEYNINIDNGSIICYKIDFSNIDEIIEENYNNISIPKLGECNIKIYGNEGTIPHFHIESKNKSFKGCIKIFVNEPFIHGKYKDILKKKEQKEFLDSFLREKDPKRHKSRWECIRDDWMEINGDSNESIVTEKDLEKSQPDYTKL